MNISQYNFDKDIRVINIGDVHRGDHCCDTELLYKHIDLIAKDENTFWLSTGDLLNTATRGGRHDSIHGSDILETEFDNICDELAPIADKCLGVVSSNHPHRVKNLTGLDLDKVMCKQLGIPYLGDFGTLNVTCGRCSYFIVMHHGSPGGGGRMKGAKINALDGMSGIIQGADIYLTGHTHQYMTHINERCFVDRKRNIVSYQKVYFNTCAHYLSWDDSYAQRLRLGPAPKGATEIKLGASMNGQNSNKRVEINLLS